MVTRDIQEVKDLISSRFNDGIKIISIDGWTGSGKSTLAESFNENSEMEIISFDDYFEKHTGLYLEVFHFDELKARILKEIDSKKNILIEGICLNQILLNISIESDYKIYIKELGGLEDWYHEKYLDETKTTEEIFMKDDEELKVDIFEDSDNIREDNPNDDDLSKQRKGVFYDLVRYHREYKPQDNGDIIFERIYHNF